MSLAKTQRVASAESLSAVVNGLLLAPPHPNVNYRARGGWGGGGGRGCLPFTAFHNGPSLFS